MLRLLCVLLKMLFELTDCVPLNLFHIYPVTSVIWLTYMLSAKMKGRSWRISGHRDSLHGHRVKYSLLWTAACTFNSFCYCLGEGRGIPAGYQRNFLLRSALYKQTVSIPKDIFLLVIELTSALE